MKRSAAALASLAVLAPLPATAAEPYDAPTLAMGGTYLVRDNDSLSPYFNPAHLTKGRGWLYVGAPLPSLGLMIGNNTLGIADIAGLGSTPPTGYFGEFYTYMQAIQAYQANVTAAIASGGDPGAPPEAKELPLPSGGELNGFLRADAGLLGLSVPWGADKKLKKLENDHAFAWRSYVRAPGIDLFINAADFVSTANTVLKTDRLIAIDLAELTKSVRDNADFSALPAKIASIKQNMADGLGPLAKEEGAKLIIGANEGAYVTNALSYQMPATDFGFLKDIALIKTMSLGATVKIHTGLGVIPAAQTALDSGLSGVFKTKDGSKVSATVPGRIEMVNTFKLKGPLDKINAALDQFGADPAGSATALQSAAGDFTKAYSAEFVSHTAAPIGLGLDIGATMPLGLGFTAGAMLQNFPTIWPGSKATYATSLGSGGGFELTKSGEAFENFSYTEPFGVRMGLGWQGPLGLSATAELGEALDGPSTRAFIGTPSLHLGIQESIFNILYLRAGAQLGGKGSILGAGVGLNIAISRIDIGVAIDPRLRGFNAALSWNVGI